MAQRFHQRFEINIDDGEARRRFVNRAYNHVFNGFFDRFQPNQRYRVEAYIVSRLGERYDLDHNIKNYIGDDFEKVLEALEAAIAAVRPDHLDDKLGMIIGATLAEAEIDLGIAWTGEIFIRTGSPVLDQELVTEPFGKLGDPKFSNVVAPFKKGLMHFLQATKRPEILPDVITDMYEALEALAKIITGRKNKDLSANAEFFIKAVNATDGYKKILKEYIEYANQFRHALEEGKPRPQLSSKEVESFIYLTGLFIRLALP
jgi:hypothetical protein